MKKVFSILILVCLILVVPSCRRTELSVSQVLAYPYMKSSGDMGLSLFVRTSITDTEKTKLHIIDPSQQLSWTVSANEVEFEGVKYLGNADISMPSGNVLPTGQWRFEFITKDGRTIGDTFEVDYRMPDAIPKDERPFFDANSNLTFIN